MTQPTCGRLWQAEASVDGRLEPVLAASFDRHLASCADCARELAALRALLDVMAALPDGRRSEIAQRRARNALLKAADERLLGGRGGLPYRPLAVGLLAAAAAVGGVWRLAAPGAGKGSEIATTARVEVRDEGAARWTEETAGGAARVSLRDGKAGFHVDGARSAAGVVVSLPDGRVEARAARFVVEVVDGRTRAVVVTEGSVSISVAGYFGALEAGGRWSRDEPARPTGTTATTATATTATTVVGAAPATATASAEPAARPRPSAEPSARAAPSATADAPPSAGARFAEAMAAFSGGDYGRADALFAAFARDFPRDGRAEDATFLRIEARKRRGDADGARAAARDYLRSFPRGLRRPEAERVAGPE